MNLRFDPDTAKAIAMTFTQAMRRKGHNVRLACGLIGISPNSYYLAVHGQLTAYIAEKLSRYAEGPWMHTFKHIGDFPADTRWIQLKGGAIAVTNDERVFRVTPSGVEELDAAEYHSKSEMKRVETLKQ